MIWNAKSDLFIPSDTMINTVTMEGKYLCQVLRTMRKKASIVTQCINLGDIGTSNLEFGP